MIGDICKVLTAVPGPYVLSVIISIISGISFLEMVIVVARHRDILGQTKEVTGSM